MSRRESAVSGQFYPAVCSEIEQYIVRFNTLLQENEFDPNTITLVPKAIIVPHAGYLYSGFTANIAFETVAQKRSTVRRVVVIGPSHRVYVKDASIALYSQYTSPCGDLKIDLEGSNALMERFSFLHFQPDAHHEHSTEVQMPFIRHYFPEAEVVEVVYGDLEPHLLATLIDELLPEPETLVVISTDLSHFHTQQEAKRLDSRCIEGMAQLELGLLEQGCEACGIIGVKAVVTSANRAGLKSLVLDYHTSGDITGDKQSVVGYVSCLVG